MIIIIYNKQISQDGALIRGTEMPLSDADLSASQYPTNTGLRLSTKARTASL